MHDQSENHSTKKIRSKLFAGLRWTGASQVLQQVLNITWSVIMARLLSPTDFGLLAMASVFTGIVYFVLDLGLKSSLIQRQTLEEKLISSVFWINVFVGLVMTVVGVVFSWSIAGFYNNPLLQPVVVALSCNFLIFSLGITQEALLNRQMDFRSLELRTLLGQFIGTVCSIVMAFWGFGVWSLVARISITTIVGTTLMWFVTNWRPRWWFRWSDVRELIGFGSDVLTSNLLAYFGRNADNFLIGKFISATALGYYTMAYNLMMFPVLRFAQVLSSVLFPALSRLQDDVEKIKSSWFRATRLIGAVTTPLMLGLIALAPQFVGVVYGEKWLPAVPLLQILALNGIVQSLTWLSSTVLVSLGKTRLLLKLTFVSVTLAFVSFLVGLPFGVVGVATCYTVVNTGMEMWSLFYTLKCVNSSYSQYIYNIGGVVTAAGGMGLAVWALVFGLHIAPIPLLLIAIGLGCIVYVILLRLVAPTVLSEALSILPERFTKRWLKFG
ncbi:putative polysaccharide transport protein [Kalymmatonema gypsitolerans NIES-4073]|nr:putative polysaccharide transport protein [Scytonema sp. NIES-4073]